MQKLKSKSLVRTDIDFDSTTSERLLSFLNTFQPFELYAAAEVFDQVRGTKPKPKPTLSRGEILKNCSDRPKYFLIDSIEPLKVFNLGEVNLRNFSIAIGHLGEMRMREKYLVDTQHIALKLKQHIKPTRKTDFEVIGRDMVNNRDIAFLPYHDGAMWQVLAVHPETYTCVQVGAGVQYEVLKYILSAVQAYEAFTCQSFIGEGLEGPRI